MYSVSMFKPIFWHTITLTIPFRKLPYSCDISSCKNGPGHPPKATQKVFDCCFCDFLVSPITAHSLFVFSVDKYHFQKEKPAYMVCLMLWPALFYSRTHRQNNVLFLVTKDHFKKIITGQGGADGAYGQNLFS